MDMKLITLEKVLHVLKTGENEMDVTGNVRKEAKRPLARMLELAGTKQTAGPARG